MLNEFLEAMHYPWKPWFGVSHNPDYWPPSVPFYDPNNDLLSLSNLKQRKGKLNSLFTDRLKNFNMSCSLRLLSMRKRCILLFFLIDDLIFQKLKSIRL